MGTAEQAGSRRRLTVFAVLSIVATFAAGMTVISVVDALGSDQCGPYGGGYCAPEINVTPTTDLVDGQAVQIMAHGFTPRKTFGAALCDPRVPGIDGCDLSNTPITTTRSSGRAVLTMNVRRIITVQGRRVDCALQPCVLGAGTVNGLDPIETDSVPVTFDPDVPPLPDLRLRLTVDEITTRRMTGTVTCTRPARATVGGSLRQGGVRPVAEGNTPTTIPCGSTPTTWTFRYSYHVGDPVPAEARFDVSASAFDDLDYVGASVSGMTTVIGPPTHPLR